MSPQNLHIAGRVFSYDHPCIVAEVAQAHDGSLGTAHAYIDAVADAGADAVKFQTHIARAESTRREPWRIRFSQQEESRYDYWRRMEFTEEQWIGLKNHAVERGLIFFSSPFSEEAVEMLYRIGHHVWKVASGEISNVPLLEKMLERPLPIILSSGMCSLADLDRAVNLCLKSGAKVSVLQCTTDYPCPPEKVGLNQLAILKDRYPVPVGFSDHSGVLASGLAATTLGIVYLETHVTFHKAMFGPDVSASLTIEGLRDLVSGIRFIEKIRTSPLDKEALYASTAKARSIFGKSIVASRDLPAGHRISRNDIAFKKPGDGIPPSEYLAVIGRTLTRPVSADDLINVEGLK